MQTTSTPPSTERAVWGSKLAFVFAASGSAIGLGNIWGFPTNAALNGGAAFLVIYLIAVVTIGAPVMLAELAIGRRTKRNPVGAFKALAPKSAWAIVGGLGVLAGLVILSFYSVIAGWSLAYILKAVTGTFTEGADTAAIFNDLAGNAPNALFWHGVFMVITVSVVIQGVKEGIERWTKVLMPVLFVILVLLIFRAVTLSGAGPGLDFYLRPDFSKVTGATVLAAVGQAFFSLSLGMGAMITYGSYLSRKDDLVSSSLIVTLADTMIAIMAGLIIFPTLFHASMDPTQGGPGMVFVTLTSLLTEIPPQPYGGVIFGTLFFMLLAIAGLTSSVSLLEVTTAYFVDEKKITRKKASIWLGVAAFTLGIPSALANGAVPWLSNLPGVGMDFLTFLFTVFGQYALVIGAFFISIFAGWVWGVSAVGEEVKANDGAFPLGRTWAFLIRFVCPIAIAALFLQLMVPVVRGLLS
jgi:NSS family neurotransmitter:Na+ symporter